MKFVEQFIKGVFLITPEPHQDERGMFRRHFCAEEFSKRDITSKVSQSNVSENFHPYTLRGFHYQTGAHAEGKTLSCLKGKIYDVVVDLRKSSPTYMKWVSLDLNQENRYAVHVPPGCANAFLTLDPNCLIHYYCSQSYFPEAEKGIRFDDPSFQFEWPRYPEVISDKDRRHPDFIKQHDR